MEGVLDPYAQVRFLSDSQMTPRALQEARALLIRTRTCCNAQTLAASAVEFVGSATIGTDHIDIPYCTGRGIEVANAPGCNAGAVMQYVFTALAALAQRRQVNLKAPVLGIIGVGHVGGRVADLARLMGFDVLLNDPPREEKEGPDGFCPLPRLLAQSDIVTLHVPLTPLTRAMADDAFFAQLRDGACFINTSRGAVVDEAALRHAAGRLGPIVLDVWNHEPQIDPQTVAVTALATEHIAGYSLEGKRNASQTVVRALARHFGWEPLFDFSVNLPPAEFVPTSLLLSRCFPIFVEDTALRECPRQFEARRSAYRFRREWTPQQYKLLPLCLQQMISSN